MGVVSVSYCIVFSQLLHTVYHRIADVSSPYSYLPGSPVAPGNHLSALAKRLFWCYIIPMKRWIWKHLLRAKYMLNGRYYWRLRTAIVEANNSANRAIVWSIDYKKMYDTKSLWESPIHPDANNFYTKW